MASSASVKGAMASWDGAVPTAGYLAREVMEHSGCLAREKAALVLATGGGGSYGGLPGSGAGAIHFYFAQKKGQCNFNTRARGRASTGLPGYEEWQRRTSWVGRYCCSVLVEASCNPVLPQEASHSSMVGERMAVASLGRGVGEYSRGAVASLGTHIGWLG